MPKQLNLAVSENNDPMAEDAANRRRALADARNARRRARYAQDSDYREKARHASRKTYEQAEGVDLEGTVEEVEERVNNIAKIAQVRPVFVERAAVGDRACLTEPEMAQVIGRHRQVFQRMINDGRWPKPIYSIRSNRTKVYVFTVEEAEALARVFLDHLRTSLHYYQYNEETKERLHTKLAEVRRNIGADKWQIQLQE